MATPAGDMDDRMTRVEYAIWGLQGNNGLTSDVRALRADLAAWQKAETQRREEESDKQRARDRTSLLAAITAILSLLGIIVTLVIVLQGVPS